MTDLENTKTRFDSQLWTFISTNTFLAGDSQTSMIRVHQEVAVGVIFNSHCDPSALSFCFVLLQDVLPCKYETEELFCSRISERVNISLCVWLRISLCSAACRQLLRLCSYWSEFTSGFGSVKYLRAPKTPARTHTCILGLRKQNLPRVLFL